jgi:adhesin transport system membrane fusion protein
MTDRNGYPDSSLSPLALAETSPLARRLARSLALLFLILLVLLAFTPWQQNVRGIGRVVAYAPTERQQVVSATVEGRVSRWLVREGTPVKQGQVLAEVRDNDPLFLERLKIEKETLLARQAAIETRVATMREQVRMAEQARPQALAAAEARIDMARERYKAAGYALEASRAARETARLNLARQQQLRGKGLASQRTLELSRQEMAFRDTEVERGQAMLQSAKNEVDALAADRQKLTADTTAAIEKNRADLNKAIEDQNYVKADLLKLETRLARQLTQTVTAPRDGIILRLLANPDAEMIKPGQPLAILIPDTAERAVELWVDGNDLPLIVNDSRVRLQFEGYPAIQFGGWPEFSVGSFGGRVALIDATDDGKGRFRILVTPDPDDLDWPGVRFLRQGVRVNGWVLLGRVTLGYELWRIFNGFPPLILPETGMIDKPKDDGKNSGSEEKKDV